MTNRTDEPAAGPAWRGLAIVGATILALGLGACRESEQGRPLAYEKGVYLGPQEAPLSEAQLRELQRRGNQQQF